MIDCSNCSVLGCQFNAIIPKKSCEMYKPYMTPKTALHCMKFNCEMAVCENCDIYGTVGTDHCFDDACREAMKALEKQIPKNLVCIEDKFLHCPCCDEALSYKWEKYPTEKINLDWLKFCWNCGQKIMWD